MTSLPRYPTLLRILNSVRINPKIYYTALISYCLAIFILSSIPGENLPKVGVEFNDKIIHLIVYAILFVLFFYSLKIQTKNIRLQKFAPEFSLLFTSLYGLSDEIHQYFVPNRTCEFVDWVADFAGGFIIYMIFKFFYLRRKTLAVIFLLSFFGCGSSQNTHVKNPDVRIGEVEAWIDLMPVINERENNFGFLINLNIQTQSPETNYSIKNFKIYLNNDTLVNRKYGAEILSLPGGEIKYSIFQSNSEMYLKKSNQLPTEVKFSFDLQQNNRKIKSIITPLVQIKKVY